MIKKSLTGWRMYLSPRYWYWQFLFLFSIARPLNVIEVFTITTDESILEEE